MSLLNRSFFAGCAVGVALTLGVLTLGAVVLVRSASDDLRSLVDEGSHFPPPEFPPGGRTSVYRDADLDWSVKTFQDDTLSVADFKGRPILVNFWATWCPPCIMEMPSLLELRAAMADSVSFLFVTEEAEEVVNRSIAPLEWVPSTHLLVGELPSMYRTEAIPATFIIDRDGRVVFRHIGAADWSAPEVREYLSGL